MTIKLNQFSGRAYYGDETFKISDQGKTFSRVGDNWVSEKGEVIKVFGDTAYNPRTGRDSTNGDPFEDE
jgi:hypothetical protein